MSRAALVIALAVVLDALVSPFLEVDWFSPRLAIIAIVFAAFRFSGTQAMLLGFFGGVLTDALGSGLFGVGALAGLLSGTLSARAGALRRKGAARVLLAQVVAVSVFAYDMIRVTALELVGGGVSPSPVDYIITRALPDALLNALLAYLIGGLLLRLMRARESKA